MPRGGTRAGAGRKPDPNSKRQQALAKKAAQGPKEARGRGFTMADGTKAPDAPKGWPFGTQAPEAPADPPADAGSGRSFKTPLEFWESVLADPEATVSAKQAAAYAMAPYVHAKLAPMGKKEEAAGKAKQTAQGRFGSTRAPVLAAANGRQV